MSEVDDLLKEYDRFVRLPWEARLAPPQRVWMAVYEPSQERRVRRRLGAFEAATRSAGHGWVAVDLTNAFAEWMAQHEYREDYFADPEALDLALPDFSIEAIRQIKDALASPSVDRDTVVAVVGLGSLFPVARSSELIENVQGVIRGRLLAFFPGRVEGPRYRLLDARDGWNYHAIVISARPGGQ